VGGPSGAGGKTSGWEQQKRMVAADRNTHFSYQLGEEGVEKFVVTPDYKAKPVLAAIRSNQGWYAISPEEWTASWTLPHRGQ